MNPMQTNGCVSSLAVLSAAKLQLPIGPRQTVGLEQKHVLGGRKAHGWHALEAWQLTTKPPPHGVAHTTAA
jgi:hypothetical protein